ncbi:hypothetical protein [Kitasatospora sp. NPDC091207]|uniref:hypothetical protein n=1 Tax=Kitasatospora sp. NPDC091207 TaxID=3364083 RepID=UPI0037F6F0E9
MGRRPERQRPPHAPAPGPRLTRTLRATVQVGLSTRHRLVFVPLDGAAVGPGYVKVVSDKPPVRDCPPIGTDDVVPPEDEETVFRHHGLTCRPGAAGERQLARR